MRLADASPQSSIRIREAAIDLFAEAGYAATSVRQIAERAEVSPGLVIQRFGDKASLRRACDDEVIPQLLRVKLDTLADPDQRNRQLSRLTRYLARMSVDETPEADHLFDLLVTSVRQLLSTSHDDHMVVQPGEDPDATAVILSILGIALLTMERQLGRHLGTPADLSGHDRIRDALTHVLGGIILPPTDRPTGRSRPKA